MAKRKSKKSPEEEQDKRDGVPSSKRISFAGHDPEKVIKAILEVDPGQEDARDSRGKRRKKST